MTVEGRTVGQYRIEKIIARTAHSIVYLAMHETLGLRVLKELPLSTDDPAAERRFVDEARIAATLVHPNVVVVHDYFIADGSAWIAMEWFRRETLAPLAGHLSPPESMGVTDAVLAALAAAERGGIVHRDVKPQNLMLTEQGDTKVADFGIARALDPDRRALTEEGRFMGSAPYVAPEIVQGKEATVASDLYSLAVVASQLVTGNVPFSDARSLEELLLRRTREELPSLKGVRDIPDGVAAVIDRMGRRDPAKRFASAAEARDELKKAAVLAWGPTWRSDNMIEDEPPPPPPPPPPHPQPGSGSRFGSHRTVTSYETAGRLLRRAATRPFNIAIGLGLTVAAVIWVPSRAWIGLATYAALVGLTFFDVEEASGGRRRGRHAAASK